MNHLAFGNNNPAGSGFFTNTAAATAAGPAPAQWALSGNNQQALANPGLEQYGVSFQANGQNRSVQQPYAQSLNQQPYAFHIPDTTATSTPGLTARLSPNAPGQQFNHPPPMTSTPPTAINMAAPALPQSPATASQSNNTTAATTSIPQSPTTSPPSRDQQRIALLLEINAEILTEINRLYAENQGGATTMQQSLQLKQAGQADKMASDDYIQLLRRLQGNLAYMMPRTGQTNSEAKVMPGPAYMQHPPMMPQLAEKYERLRELFPEWGGNDAKLMAMAASAGGGAGSPVQRVNPQQQQLLQQQQSQQQQQQQSNINGSMS